MKCPRCQADNRDGARFCRECGATFATVCASCGAKVEAGSKFCDSCGVALAAAPTPPAGGAVCLSWVVYAEALGGTDPHVQDRPQRRTQAGDGVVRRPQGLAQTRLIVSDK